MAVAPPDLKDTLSTLSLPAPHPPRQPLQVAFPGPLPRGPWLACPRVYPRPRPARRRRPRAGFSGRWGCCSCCGIAGSAGAPAAGQGWGQRAVTAAPALLPPRASLPPRGLTWPLSGPTRLPSTGPNGELHTRFSGERLSGVSPGLLKATGLACGGGGRGRLRCGDRAPICPGLASSLSQTELHPPGVWEARGTRVRGNSLKHRNPSPGHISRTPASLMPPEARRAKAGPRSPGAPRNHSPWAPG